MKAPQTKSALKALLSDRALVVGPITLSNGTQSNHYFNCKRVTLTSEGATLIGDAVLDAILTLPEWPSAIGGLTHGADPIISAVMMRARESGRSIDGFYVRKEPKKHGTKDVIENAPERGAAVVIVDDVVTAGGSVLQAVREAKAAGCRVLAVITVVDRLEGGTAKIKAEVSRYIPLYTVEDFQAEIDRKWRKDTTKSDSLLARASL